MPHYSFDVKLGETEWSRDDDGVDLADDSVAHREAIRYIAELAREEIASHRSIEIRVRDNSQQPLFTLGLTLETAGAKL